MRNAVRLAAPILAAGLLAGGPALSADIAYWSATTGSEFVIQPRDGVAERSGVFVAGRVELRLNEAWSAVGQGRQEFARERRRSDAGGDDFYDPRTRIDELSLKYAGGLVDLALGKQIVTWGIADGFRLLDRLNGIDQCDYLRLDTDRYKRSSWMMNGKVTSGSFSANAIYLPYSPESRLGRPGTYCEDLINNANAFGSLREPSNERLSRGGGGMALNYQRDAWSASLNALTMHEDIFAVRVFPEPGKTKPRVWWFGGTVDANLGGNVVRAELAMSPKRRFNIAQPDLFDAFLQGRTEDGLSDRRNILVLVGYDTDWNDWSIQFQEMVDRIDGGPDLNRRRTDSFTSVRLRRAFSHDRLTASVFAILDNGNRDLAVRGDVAYDLTERLTLSAGGVYYSDLSGGRTGIFGSYDNRPAIFLRGSYRL